MTALRELSVAPRILIGIFLQIFRWPERRGLGRTFSSGGKMRMARLTWRAGFFGAALPAGVCAIVTGAFMATARADVVLSGPTSNAGTYSTAALASLATSSDTVSA